MSLLLRSIQRPIPLSRSELPLQYRLGWRVHSKIASLLWNASQRTYETASKGFHLQHPIGRKDVVEFRVDRTLLLLLQ